jgi:hypothetical protein
MTLHRGMLPWREEAIPLKFDAYIDRAKLPAVPKKFGHVGSAQPPVKGGWGILGNDKAGCCVRSGFCHEIMVWAWATKRPIPPFNSQLVLKQYYERTGGQDTGLDPIAEAKFRCSTGIADAAGAYHKTKAFASVGTADIELCAYLFGICGVGAALPDNAEAQFLAGKPWTDTSGAPNRRNGHYFTICGKNTAGNLIAVTWGRLQAISKEYLNKYCVGGVCYFSLEYLLTTGASPELFDEAQLDADLASLGMPQAA